MPVARTRTHPSRDSPICTRVSGPITATIRDPASAAARTFTHDLAVAPTQRARAGRDAGREAGGLTARDEIRSRSAAADGTAGDLARLTLGSIGSAPVAAATVPAPRAVPVREPSGRDARSEPASSRIDGSPLDASRVVESRTGASRAPASLGALSFDAEFAGGAAARWPPPPESGGGSNATEDSAGAETMVAGSLASSSAVKRHAPSATSVRTATAAAAHAYGPNWYARSGGGPHHRHSPRLFG
jgi:hypothetical protein